MLISAELTIKIIFTVISLVTGFYGVVNLIFYKLSLPGFEGKWVIHMSATLLAVSVALIILAYTFI
ncbi:hypothetical protein SJAV_08160 [Sulfurisphaera javensis]|uniref:Uncharacterized protein n=1 Tax=Sulfurisphaera javensis TaxID=2049879 RepID=A0AAT9GPV7_9CREN